MDNQAFELLTKQLESFDTDIRDIKKDIKTILEFRSQVLGWSAALSFIGSITVTLVTKFFF